MNNFLKDNNLFVNNFNEYIYFNKNNFIDNKNIFLNFFNKKEIVEIINEYFYDNKKKPTKLILIFLICLFKYDLFENLLNEYSHTLEIIKENIFILSNTENVFTEINTHNFENITYFFFYIIYYLRQAKSEKAKSILNIKINQNHIIETLLNSYDIKFKQIANNSFEINGVIYEIEIIYNFLLKLKNGSEEILYLLKGNKQYKIIKGKILDLNKTITRSSDYVNYYVRKLFSFLNNKGYAKIKLDNGDYIYYFSEGNHEFEVKNNKSEFYLNGQKIINSYTGIYNLFYFYDNIFITEKNEILLLQSSKSLNRNKEPFIYNSDKFNGPQHNNNKIQYNNKNSLISLKFNSDFTIIKNNDINDLTALFHSSIQNGDPFISLLVINKISQNNKMFNQFINTINDKFNASSFLCNYFDLILYKKEDNVYEFDYELYSEKVKDKLIFNFSDKTEELNINPNFEYKNIKNLFNEIKTYYNISNLNSDGNTNINKFFKSTLICEENKDKNCNDFINYLLDNITNFNKIKETKSIDININFYTNLFNNKSYNNFINNNLKLIAEITELNQIIMFIKNFPTNFCGDEKTRCFNILEIIDLINPDKLKLDRKEIYEYIFEYFFEGIIFKTQSDFVEEILKEDRPFIRQLLMGRGKTSVITPLLVLNKILNLKDNPTRNTMIVLPKHLMLQTSEIFSNFYPLNFNLDIINYGNNPNYEIFNKPADHKSLTVIDSESIKYTLLNAKINNLDNPNLKNYYLIFDEIDFQVDYLSSEFNIPLNKKEYFDNNLLNNYFQILADLYKKFDYKNKNIEILNKNDIDIFFNGEFNLGKKEFKDIKIDELNLDQLKKYLKNYGIDITTNNEFSFYKLCLYYLRDCFLMIINKEYGRSTTNNKLIAVPYSQVNTPLNDSQFSSIYITINLTYLCYLEQGLLKNDFIFMINNIKNLINKIQISSDDISKRINFLEPFIKYQDILDDSKINQNLQILEKQNQNTKLIKYFINNFTNSQIYYNSQQYSSSLLNIISPYFSKNKTGFSGSINFDLPNYEDNTSSFYTLPLEDAVSIGAVETAILGLILPTTVFRINKDLSFDFSISEKYHASEDEEIIEPTKDNRNTRKQEIVIGKEEAKRQLEEHLKNLPKTTESTVSSSAFMPVKSPSITQTIETKITENDRRLLFEVLNDRKNQDNIEKTKESDISKQVAAEPLDPLTQTIIEQLPLAKQKVTSDLEKDLKQLPLAKQKVTSDLEKDLKQLPLAKQKVTAPVPLPASIPTQTESIDDFLFRIKDFNNENYIKEITKKMNPLMNPSFNEITKDDLNKIKQKLLDRFGSDTKSYDRATNLLFMKIDYFKPKVGGSIGGSNDKLDAILDKMVEEKIGILIDCAAYYKVFNGEEIASKLFEKFGGSRDVFFLDNDSNKFIFKQTTKDKLPISFLDSDFNKIAGVFTQDKIVGIDIKLPFGCKFLCTINNKSNLTEVSQAIFRARKLNKGHHLYFIYDSEFFNNIVEVLKPAQLKEIFEKNSNDYKINSEFSKNVQYVKDIRMFKYNHYTYDVFIEKITKENQEISDLKKQYVLDNICIKDKLVENTCAIIRESSDNFSSKREVVHEIGLETATEISVEQESSIEKNRERQKYNSAAINNCFNKLLVNQKRGDLYSTTVPISEKITDLLNPDYSGVNYFNNNISPIFIGFNNDNDKDDIFIKNLYNVLLSKQIYISQHFLKFFSTLNALFLNLYPMYGILNLFTQIYSSRPIAGLKNYEKYNGDKNKQRLIELYQLISPCIIEIFDKENNYLRTVVTSFAQVNSAITYYLDPKNSLPFNYKFFDRFGNDLLKKNNKVNQIIVINILNYMCTFDYFDNADILLIIAFFKKDAMSIFQLNNSKYNDYIAQITGGYTELGNPSNRNNEFLKQFYETGSIKVDNYDDLLEKIFKTKFLTHEKEIIKNILKVKFEYDPDFNSSIINFNWKSMVGGKKDIYYLKYLKYKNKYNQLKLLSNDTK